MPAGRFSKAETIGALRRLHASIADTNAEHDRDEMRLQLAITLIKAHISNSQTPLNQDLHNAVGLIVDFARKHGHLTR